MILTVTPNPCLDRTVTLSSPLRRGGVNRLSSVTTQPGGKGINVARVLAAAGCSVRTIMPAPAHSPVLVALQQVAPDLPFCHVAVAGESRMNIAVTEADGTTTKLNEPGAPLTDAECAALESAVIREVRESHDSDDPVTWVVLSGSLPAGMDTCWYSQMTGRLHELGVRVAVDTSEEPLVQVAAGLGEAPVDLLKPNGEELAHLARASRAGATQAGRTGVGTHTAELEDLEAQAIAGNYAPAAAAARRLVQAGVGTVLASLGPAGGLLATAQGIWCARAPEVPVVSTVGAGDSCLAGFLAAQVAGDSPEGCLATALRYGSAAASLAGTTLPTRADVLRVPEPQLRAWDAANRGEPAGG